MDQIKNKTIKIISLVLGFTLVFFTAILCGIGIMRSILINKNDYNYLNGGANKVILFIGDGMGENHINVSSTYLKKEPIFNKFTKNGYVTTFSRSLFSPTDSAAAGTALATGKKVNNGEIAYHNDQEISSISDYAKKMGLGVGIVTTDNLSGATPSAFSASARNRGDTEDIILSQVNSNIDLFLATGKSTYNSYQTQFIEYGYSFLSIEDIKNTNILRNKVIGTYDEIDNYQAVNGPTLPMLVEYAIEYFETNYPNGYFLMVEGAHIDKMSHENNINEMIKYFDEFNTSIEYAYNKYKNDSEVALIVTADHETGKLKNTTDINMITNDLYRSTGHTSRKVRYYINLKNDKVNKIDRIIDNTNIYLICKALLKSNN